MPSESLDITFEALHAALRRPARGRHSGLRLDGEADLQQLYRDAPIQDFMKLDGSAGARTHRSYEGSPPGANLEKIERVAAHQLFPLSAEPRTLSEVASSRSLGRRPPGRTGRCAALQQKIDDLAGHGGRHGAPDAKWHGLARFHGRHGHDASALPAASRRW